MTGRPERAAARRWWWAAALLLALTPGARADEVYQRPEDFLAETFAGAPPPPAMLWITPDMRGDIDRILGHAHFNALRVRYWGRDGRTAWILEEIGKYEPITTGLVVRDGRMERVKVLIYRESHGWEVRYPFFTNQFKDLELAADNRLNKSIDGISGATLSVNALRNLARLALYLHAQATSGQ